ncbi:hypothetical protein RB628_19480 [Streptomyces sp. ADMS]|nr:hypothetical protein [Streptomyces sp. ADMS]MDW4907469.1 hypothetical protein [Streptomyces sp. ADMS]
MQLIGTSGNASDTTVVHDTEGTYTVAAYLTGRTGGPAEQLTP